MITTNNGTRNNGTLVCQACGKRVRVNIEAMEGQKGICFTCYNKAWKAFRAQGSGN